MEDRMVDQVTSQKQNTLVEVEDMVVVMVMVMEEVEVEDTEDQAMSQYLAIMVEMVDTAEVMEAMVDMVEDMMSLMIIIIIPHTCTNMESMTRKQKIIKANGNTETEMSSRVNTAWTKLMAQNVSFHTHQTKNQDSKPMFQK
jgi:hypothetical protein